MAGSTSNGYGDEVAGKEHAKKIGEKLSTSNCFRCGKKGHWKRECPEESEYKSDSDLSMMTVKEKRSESFYGYEVCLDNG